MGSLMDFLTVFTQPQLLALVGVGTFAGVYVGAIPGLSVTMAVSILISFTFSWDVYPAISLMIGIYMGGVYGGSTSPGRLRPSPLHWTAIPWPRGARRVPPSA